MSEENKKQEVVNQEENTKKEILSEDEMENVNGGGYFDGLLTYSGPPPVKPAPAPTPAPPKAQVPTPKPPTTTNIYGHVVNNNGRP